MKSSIAALAFLTAAVSAAPTDYTPPDGWESVKYPAGTGANLDKYPAPPGGWENVKYPPGTGANGADCPPAFGNFTSTYAVVATPDQVVNGTTNPVFTGGLPGSIGYYNFGINSDLDLICWNIKLIGFSGEYQSAAKTATHVHEGAMGQNGPPRLAFPNPVGEGHERYSFGCMTGPFTTGVIADGTDTGAGFKVKQIEANPAGFFADVHSSKAVPGAVRGQIA